MAAVSAAARELHRDTPPPPSEDACRPWGLNLGPQVEACEQSAAHRFRIQSSFLRQQDEHQPQQGPEH
eukprot:689868-Prymnesium_polylepis.2